MSFRADRLLASPWVYRTYLALGLAGVVAYRFCHGAPAVAVYGAIGLYGILGSLAGMLRGPLRAALPRLVLTVGFALLVTGDVEWFVEDLLGHIIPTPSASDALYLCAYPVIAVGIGLLHRRRGGRATFVDAVIVTVALATVVWSPLFATFRASAGHGFGERLTLGAYPMWDLLLLFLLARFALGRSIAPWRGLLTAAVMLLFVGDFFWAASAETYALGDWVDCTWLLAYVCLGASSLHPSAGVPDEAVPVADAYTPRRFAMLAIPVSVLPVVQIVEALLGHRLHLVDALLTSGLLLLLLVRLVGVVNGLQRARAQAAESERQLAERNEQLEEADRLKDELISIVSHDLRTPLTSIMGYLELALDPESDGDLSDERRDYLFVAERNTQRLHRLVEDLLFVSSVKSGRAGLQLVPTDVGRLARDAVENALPTASSAGIHLSSRCDPNVIASIDHHRVSEAIENLLSNSLKFTPPGGRVDVRVTGGDDDVTICVSDTGIGVSQKDVEHLFDRFFRTASAEGIPGAGLGLSIVKAIVDAHGGEIEVESGSGTGTTFELTLPRSAVVTAALEALA